MKSTNLILCSAAILFCQPIPSTRQPLKLPCIADTIVSSYPSEQDFNYGQSSRLRVKGHESMALLRFDTAPLRGWTVNRATLVVRPTGPHRLKTLGLSTIAIDWNEGTGNGSKSGDGATFLRASATNRWGGNQSDFTDAALTAQGTNVEAADIRERPDGWVEVDVPPRLIHAMVDGSSFGMALIDEKGQTRFNNDIYSREQSGSAPYLLVDGANTQRKSEIRRIPKSQYVPPPNPTPIEPFPGPDWSGSAPKAVGGFRVWAYGELEKADPISGNLLEETGDGGYAGAPSGKYRERNSVWDGGTNTVHLSAGRNEFVGFNLCIEPIASSSAVQISPFELKGEHGTQITKEQIGLFRDWYVRDGEWYPEVAIPIQDKFTIPDPQNAIPGQRNQSVFVELYIPHKTVAGIYHGKLETRTDSGNPSVVNIELTVGKFTLPDDLTFDVDLNAYGPPGDAEMELQFHRMAHAHRTTLNILGYNQAGKADPDYVPKLAGAGKEMVASDWSAFDQRFGRYFDGSAFVGMPRKSVPLKHAYLPFCEGWPSDIRKHYNYVPTTNTYPESIAEHALRAKPIEQAFDQTFKEEFTTVARQTARHLREKGWDRTEFQFYLNDKYYFKDPAQGGRGSSWWLLDEPMHRDDWLALRFFGKMFKDGTKPEVKDGFPKLAFRADISRPQWQRDWLDGLVDLMCVSGEFFSKNERCMQMQRDDKITFWHYGTGNDIRVSNLTGEAWALKAYLAGADGILPWNSLGGDESFVKPTPTTILYPGGRFGVKGPLASLRLKGFRRGQQDAEYLNLLARNKGWNRQQLTAAVSRLLSLDGKTRASFVDDAGQTLFEKLTSKQFAELRAAVTKELVK